MVDYRVPNTAYSLLWLRPRPTHSRTLLSQTVVTRTSDRTLIAAGTYRSTYVLSVLYHECVVMHEVFLRDNVPEFLLTLRRGLGLNQTDPVGNPMDVGVHGQCRFPETIDHDASRGLPPNTRELDEFHHILGSSACMPFQYDPANLFYPFGFGIVIICRSYEFGDLLNWGSCQRFRRGVARKKSPGSLVGFFVSRSL